MMKVKTLDWINPIYEIDDSGNVYSIERLIKNGTGGIFKKPRKKLKPRINLSGYLYISLDTLMGNKTTKRKSISVHRLVAKAFLVKSDNKLEVNHIDGNKQNNHVSNLEWCNRHYNIQHAYKTGLLKPVIHTSISKQKISQSLLKKHPKSRPVVYWEKSTIKWTKNPLGEFKDSREAARILGIDSSCVYRACSGKIKYYKNWVWAFKKDQPKESLMHKNFEK